MADSDARVLALQSGEVDLANTIDYSSLKLFRNNKDYSGFRSFMGHVQMLFI